MDQLVLFCGGPPIYPGGVPKPLQLVDERQTLVELYVSSSFAGAFSTITILCETDYLSAFEKVSRGLRVDSEIAVTETPNGSSTLEKLSLHLESTNASDVPTVFTYPDIFYFGTLPEPASDYPWHERVTLSLQTLKSRFPRVIVEPYSGQVRSITTHQGAVPANPVHLFGGHLMASPALLVQVLNSIGEQRIRDGGSLEVDAFSWMINRGMVDSILLDQLWLKADSPRDLEEIRSTMVSDWQTAPPALGFNGG